MSTIVCITKICKREQVSEALTTHYKLMVATSKAESTMILHCISNSYPLASSHGFRKVNLAAVDIQIRKKKHMKEMQILFQNFQKPKLPNKLI